MPNEGEAAKLPSYSAPALEKGLDILEFLSNVTEPMGLSSISQAVGRSKSEIYRMLHVLERRRYLERVPGVEQYTLTNRLFLLGMERPPLAGLLEIGLPRMHALAEETKQSCHMAVPSDDFMVVIARVEAPADIGVVVRIGHRRHILSATSGLVLTAFQNEETRERWLRDYSGMLPAEERAELEDKITQIAEDGFAAFKSSVVPDILDISCPILYKGAAVAALTIPYLNWFKAAASRSDAINLLRATAASISERLA